MKDRVLVVTHTLDNRAASGVLEAVAARGLRGVRLDSDAFPTAVRLDLDPVSGEGVLHLPDQSLPTAGLRAAWVRRLAVGHGLSDRLPPDERLACQGESREALVGWLDGLPCPVLGRPAAVRAARDKLAQLRAAAAAGLAVPETRVTNDPDAVQALAARHPGGLVAKMLHPFALRREGVEQVVFTSRLAPADLADLTGLALSPMVFQQAIAAVEELRVTVVGVRQLVARLPRRADEAVDWRQDARDHAGRWTAGALAPAEAAAVSTLCRALGLDFAAIDLLRDAGGRLWFLEANPAGEWLWLEQAAGLAISAAIADWLVEA